jgi:hypothetical protein
MDQTDDNETRPAGAAEPADTSAGETEPAAAAPAPGAAASTAAARPGSGLRLLGAIVTLPWLLGYGVTGVWAVAFGARTYADGLKQIDAGYTRFVTPTELMYVGALLLAGFAVVLACGLLLLFDRRSAMVWLPLLFVAAGLTAGSVWAAARGGLHPGLWLLYFFGIAYAAAVALARTIQVTRAARRGRIAGPQGGSA